mmetsp:Transcript_31072/g.41079  ORF Transcript_31072/g.41079 Transcript_31072/m.41079 type:complete len:350 (+) Transcript_31072:46-1095(+)
MADFVTGKVDTTRSVDGNTNQQHINASTEVLTEEEDKLDSNDTLKDPNEGQNDKFSDIQALAEQVEDQMDIKNMIFPAENRIDFTAERAGYSTDGFDYPDIKSMWQAELMGKQVGAQEDINPENEFQSKEDGRNKWYQKGADYWESEENCSADIAGVLGGFPELSEPDIRDNNQFLDEVIKIRPELQFEKAADCGAGVGRLTRDFLLDRFQRVDLVEQSPRLTKAAPDFIGERADQCRFFCLGLQDYKPPAGSLDCVWTQWVVGHLTDVDFVNYLKRCKQSLKPGGVLIVKDNCCEDEAFVVDSDDSSVTRCPLYMRSLFQNAGLTVLLQRQQRGFPSDLYPVHMFCLI